MKPSIEAVVAVTVAVKRAGPTNSPRRSAWSEMVVRGGVEPPTFRFSGLRITIQDRPWKSFSLLSDLRYTPMDAGVRGCMRLEMRLCRAVTGHSPRFPRRCPVSVRGGSPWRSTWPGRSFAASMCLSPDGDSRPTTPHRVDGRYRTMSRDGITRSDGAVQRGHAWNRLRYGRAVGASYSRSRLRISVGL